jgi:hypothetical protein
MICLKVLGLRITESLGAMLVCSLICTRVKDTGDSGAVFDSEIREKSVFVWCDVVFKGEDVAPR